MFIPNLRRLSRRRFVSLAAAAAGAAVLGPSHPARAAGIINQVPFFAQGGTGDQSSVNCGMAAVAAAVNYSTVAYPTVADVRATLGLSGPTDITQWAWLLDAYGAPWYPTWTREDFDGALRAGHAVVIAAWMADFSVAPDFEVPWSAFWGQSGRYDGYDQGHAMTVVGVTDDGLNYLIHDPNVFPDNGTSYYGDGAPKGAYRPYNADEVWFTISNYAGGQGLAVAGPVLPAPEAPPPPVKRVNTKDGDLFRGPGGGHAPERGERGVTGVIVPPSQRGVISSASDDGDGGAASAGP